MTDTKKIPFGKYRGSTYKDLVQHDPEYALWMAGVMRDEDTKKYILENCPKKTVGDWTINFGKYGEHTYDWLLENDRPYAAWIAEKAKNKKIRKYLTEKLEPEILSTSYEQPTLGGNQQDHAVCPTTSTCSTG